MKMTQKEMVTRYLAARIGTWVPGYVLVSKASSAIGADYLIQDADTRAHELAREGYYDSPHHRYFVETRRKGKYAEFRVSRKEPLPTSSKKPIDWTAYTRDMQSLWDSTPEPSQA